MVVIRIDMMIAAGADLNDERHRQDATAMFELRPTLVDTPGGELGVEAHDGTV